MAKTETADMRIAVVTGANRGLGFETCRQLAQQGLRVILAGRELAKGEDAAAALRSDGLDVDAYQLDVTDPQSATRLAAQLRDTLGRVDVLVNNAGVMLDPPGAEGLLDVSVDILVKTLDTNLVGAWNTSKALVPMMKERGYGRVVNVTSGLGQLSEMSGSAWPAYRVSKAALNALTRVLALELSRTNILVNAVCPGWVRTDMGGPYATRSVEEGVDTIVWLATLPDGGPTGKLFRDREPIGW
ncbi:MAG: SDR family oxidoreductase [Nitrospiraceae bacterium]